MLIFQTLWRALQLFTAFILFALMVITLLDVVGRYFLNAPLAGAFELTRLAMGLLVFSALPLVTARERHIVVSLFDPLFAANPRRRALPGRMIDSAFVSHGAANPGGVRCCRRRRRRRR